MSETPDFDAVVIGSGVCGAVCAWQLGSNGARVLLLEAGDSGADRMTLVKDLATTVSPFSRDDPDHRAPAPDTMPTYEDYYDVATPKTFRSGYLRRIGGSTWHFLGNVPRLIPNDFAMKSQFGVGVDWPISYDDLEPDYCEAESLMGVSGDHQEWDGLLGARRSRTFPMTYVWPSYSDRVLGPKMEAVSIDGIPIRVMKTPQARNSEPYDGRPACAGNSSCVPLCPIGAKYDGTVHVRKAATAGVEIRKRAVVFKLEVEAGGSQITSVHYRDWTGQDHQVSGRVVVLAAHAIETPKILLSSGDRGLANSSDQVGRNLMDHAQGAGRCLTPEPVFGFRGPPTTSGIDVFRDGEFRRSHAAFRMSLGNDGWGRGESPARTLEKLVTTSDLFGRELREQVSNRFTRMFRISFSTEVLPVADNRITLSDQRDSIGIFRPKIAFKIAQYNLDAFSKAQAIIAALFDGIGGSEVKFTLDWSGAGHILGTCRMGDDPKTSVVDSLGRSHDHRNLFVLGASVFPTCGTANPTLTALALTLRTTRTIQTDLAIGGTR